MFCNRKEAKEEAGIKINSEDLELIHVMHRKCPNEERIDFFIRAKEWKGKPKNLEPNKCDDLSWFRLNKLPKNLIPYVRQAISFIRKGILYSEHGW